MKKIGFKSGLIKCLVSLLFIICLIFGCQEKTDFMVPEALGELELHQVISGKEAIQAINELHGLPVAANENIIAEYGTEKMDLLYISGYKDKKEALEVFNQMIDKMKAAKNSPFNHIKAIRDYNNQVYIALGMGAFHYIYAADRHILWLQTYQTFGRNLPPELVKLYPVQEGKQSI